MEGKGSQGRLRKILNKKMMTQAEQSTGKVGRGMKQL
jgi:hypothetical protein